MQWSALRWWLYLLLVGVLLFTPLPQMTSEISTRASSLKQSVHVTLYTPPEPVKTVVPPKPAPQPKPKPKPKPLPKSTPKPTPNPQQVPPPEPVKKVPEVPHESETPQVQQAPSTPPQVTPNALQSYEAKLRERIFMQKFYPTKARRLKHQGDVTVRFVVTRDGTISKYNITGSSGFATLDKAVEKLFSRIRRFEPPPESLATPYEFSITLNYRLK